MQDQPYVHPAGDDLMFEFPCDLTAHETQRVAAVLAAIEDWDPAAALAGEAEAHRLLYSGLDAGQLAVYELLVAEGLIDA